MAQRIRTGGLDSSDEYHDGVSSPDRGALTLEIHRPYKSVGLRRLRRGTRPRLPPAYRPQESDEEDRDHGGEGVFPRGGGPQRGHQDQYTRTNPSRGWETQVAPPPQYGTSIGKTEVERSICVLEGVVRRDHQEPRALFRQAPPKATTPPIQLPAVDIDLLRLTYSSYGSGVSDDPGPEIVWSLLSNDVLPLLKAWYGEALRSSLIEDTFRPEASLADWCWQVDRIARHAYNHGAQEVALETQLHHDQVVLGTAAQIVALIHRRCQLVRNTEWQHETKGAYFGYVVCAMMLLTAYQDLRGDSEGFFAVAFKSALADPMLRRVRPRWEDKVRTKLERMETAQTAVLGPLFTIASLTDTVADEVEASGEDAGSTVPFTPREDLALLVAYNAANRVVERLRQRPSPEAQAASVSWEEITDILPCRTADEYRDAFQRLMDEKLEDSSDEENASFVNRKRHTLQAPRFRRSDRVLISCQQAITVI